MWLAVGKTWQDLGRMQKDMVTPSLGVPWTIPSSIMGDLVSLRTQEELRLTLGQFSARIKNLCLPLFLQAEITLTTALLSFGNPPSQLPLWWFAGECLSSASRHRVSLEVYHAPQRQDINNLVKSNHQAIGMFYCWVYCIIQVDLGKLSRFLRDLLRLYFLNPIIICFGLPTW